MTQLNLKPLNLLLFGGMLFFAGFVMSNVDASGDSPITINRVLAVPLGEAVAMGFGLILLTGAFGILFARQSIERFTLSTAPIFIYAFVWLVNALQREQSGFAPFAWYAGLFIVSNIFFYKQHGNPTHKITRFIKDDLSLRHVLGVWGIGIGLSIAIKPETIGMRLIYNIMDVLHVQHSVYWLLFVLGGVWQLMQNMVIRGNTLFEDSFHNVLLGLAPFFVHAWLVVSFFLTGQFPTSGIPILVMSLGIILIIVRDYYPPKPSLGIDPVEYERQLKAELEYLGD